MQLPAHSVLPLQWRLTHSPRWTRQILVSELSLVAFVLLLVMVFSEKWLHAPGCRFHQYHPANVSHGIHTSIHIMSLGLLHICISESCTESDYGKDSSKMWTNQPMFQVAKVGFCLVLELGLVLTIWLHLCYLPRLKKLRLYRLIGVILSCEATFIFTALLLFAINLWTFELKKNISVPIGWSYFIGWLVFLLYVTCGALCYSNYVSHPLPRGFGSTSRASSPAH
nr:outer dense fiber protein 4 [Cavia porcellus]